MFTLILLDCDAPGGIIVMAAKRAINSTVDAVNFLFALFAS
jgi:hypothetical protein